MSRQLDVLVIGGGVVGLACAAALATRGHSVALLERNAGVARETSSRSSGVVHAGLYYPPGSLKAELCRRGRELLGERCERLGIPQRRVGKLVVATSAAQLPALEALRAQGERCGAPGLALLAAAQVAAREPCVRAHAALFSPASGIVDAMALAHSYAAELEAHGGILATRAQADAIEPTAGGYRVHVARGDGSRESIEVPAVVNAAGLSADRVAALAGIDVDAAGYRQQLCKGDYFALAASAPFRFQGLVYPLPSGAGLGIHVTLDLRGHVRLGPDAEYVREISYAVDAAKAASFAASAATFVPGLRAEQLAPDQAGVRPKLAKPGEGFRDFVVCEESVRGLAGFVNLVGIESPGLTAAPAIAERVADLLASV